MAFDIGAIAHVVLNDGSVALVQSKDNSEREVRSIPITLEVDCKFVYLLISGEPISFKQ